MNANYHDAIKYRTENYYKPAAEKIKELYGAVSIANIINPEDQMNAVNLMYETIERAKRECIYKPNENTVNDINLFAQLGVLEKKIQGKLQQYKMLQDEQQKFTTARNEYLDKEIELEKLRRENNKKDMDELSQFYEELKKDL